jgi:hypothetical protein
VLIACHARLRALLDRIEALADALPDPPAVEVCDRLCRDLAGMTALVVMLQDEYFADVWYRPSQDPVVARIREWRSADTLHLRDTVVALRRFAGGADDARVTPDTLGYMLRCSFDGWRRLLDHVELAIAARAGALPA